MESESISQCERKIWWSGIEFSFYYTIQVDLQINSHSIIASKLKNECLIGPE